MSEWKEKFVKAVLDKLKETDTPYGHTDEFGLINLQDNQKDLVETD